LKNIYQTRRGVTPKNIFFQKNFALYLQGLTNNFFKKILKIPIKRAGSPNYGGLLKSPDRKKLRRTI
jgi:hypothetical protein